MTGYYNLTDSGVSDQPRHQSFQRVFDVRIEKTDRGAQKEASVQSRRSRYR